MHRPNPPLAQIPQRSLPMAVVLHPRTETSRCPYNPYPPVLLLVDSPRSPRRVWTPGEDAGDANVRATRRANAHPGTPSGGPLSRAYESLRLRIQRERLGSPPPVQSTL